VLIAPSPLDEGKVEKKGGPCSAFDVVVVPNSARKSN
jgi:hypothetical protein